MRRRDVKRTHKAIEGTENEMGTWLYGRARMLPGLDSHRSCGVSFSNEIR